MIKVALVTAAVAIIAAAWAVRRCRAPVNPVPGRPIDGTPLSDHENQRLSVMNNLYGDTAPEPPYWPFADSEEDR